MAPVIERHGHERIPVILARVLIVGFGEPRDEPAIVVKLLVVLEAEHGLEHLAVGATGRARPLEMPAMLRALVADDGRVKLPERGKGLTALAAKRGDDAHRLGFGAFLPREREVQGAFAPVPGTGSGTMEGCR